MSESRLHAREDGPSDVLEIKSRNRVTGLAQKTCDPGGNHMESPERVPSQCLVNMQRRRRRSIENGESMTCGLEVDFPECLALLFAVSRLESML